jgi:hypothetical protein
MINGIVNVQIEAIISLNALGSSGAEATIEAVIDTGFNGYLTMPQPLIDFLGLPWRRRGSGTLADAAELSLIFTKRRSYGMENCGVWQWIAQRLIHWLVCPSSRAASCLFKSSRMGK